MQGDIFQLESLTNQVTVPEPQPVGASSGPTTIVDPQVAIYNEDDLSHLLYIGNKSNNNDHHHDHHHHHHHHQHHHQTHKQKPFTHPADAAGTILINAAMLDDAESLATPALSDAGSCSGSDSDISGTDSTATPPPESELGREAYRCKGRRNAVCTDFPVFLGRQDEDFVEEERQEEEGGEEVRQITLGKEALAHRSLNLLSPALSPAVAARQVKTEEEVVPTSRHVDAVDGALMSWWPADTMSAEHDWTPEDTAWAKRQGREGMRLEKERLREREGRPVRDGDYGVGHVSRIAGPLMSWWPEQPDTTEYEWDEHFYE